MQSHMEEIVNLSVCEFHPAHGGLPSHSCISNPADFCPSNTLHQLILLAFHDYYVLAADFSIINLSFIITVS